MFCSNRLVFSILTFWKIVFIRTRVVKLLHFDCTEVYSLCTSRLSRLKCRSWNYESCGPIFSPNYLLGADNSIPLRQYVDKFWSCQHLEKANHSLTNTGVVKELTSPSQQQYCVSALTTNINDKHYLSFIIPNLFP